jgi:20S proteasome subunit beta 6
MAAISSYSMPTSTRAFSFQSAPTTASDGARQHAFYPYTDNGGSTLGISGDTFTVLAGDTRSTSGYNINTRYEPKLFRIGGDGPEHAGSKIVLSVVGFAADGHALQERLDTVVKMYKYQHGKDISVHACAQRLSHILYNKRFFPYYVQAILGGIDEEGKGALYSYDPVGSYEREYCRAAGAAASLIMPFLDNQVNLKNQYEPPTASASGLDQKALVPKPLDRATTEELVRDAFTSAVERHIEVGDGLQMMIITKDGIEEIYHDLKKD